MNTAPNFKTLPIAIVMGLPALSFSAIIEGEQNNDGSFRKWHRIEVVFDGRRASEAFRCVKVLTSLALMAPLAHGQSKDDSHMEWWRDARYDMFVHWGLYSVAEGEWKGKDYGKEQGGASAEWVMNSAKIPKEEYRNTSITLCGETI